MRDKGQRTTDKRTLARTAVACSLFALAVGTLWAFPGLWYHAPDAGPGFCWLGEQEEVPGWTFNEIPAGKAAEARLVADRMQNGEFESRSSLVRVFSAKRYREKENEIGLFSHTPDRCWTGAGWQIQLQEPLFVDCQVGGITLRFERRCFVSEQSRELVYFGAIVGGKPLPYRLDQYLEACVAKTRKNASDDKSVWLRLRSSRVWSWTLDSFRHRTAFGGPQHLIRISTPIHGDDLAAADKLLQGFLPQWLKPGSYEEEVTDQRLKTKDQGPGTKD